MSWFNSLFGRGGVRPVQVRDVTNVRALPPAGSPSGALPPSSVGGGLARSGALAPRGRNPGLGLAGLLYSIPGYAEQKQRNAADVINYARTAPGIGGLIPGLPTFSNQPIPGGMGGARGSRASGMPSSRQEPQVGQQAVLGGKPVYWGGKDYGWQQLNGGSASQTINTLNAPVVQNRFVQNEDYGVGGGSVSSVSSGGSLAERAYQQEKSRVAQLTAQDPELQRYETARKAAAVPGATPQQVQPAEDIGMQIWQNKYGSTPMGRPGGAVGSFNPLMQRTFGYQTSEGPYAGGVPTLGPTPLVPQVDPALNPASPTFAGGEGAPLFNFSDDNLTPEMIEAYQKQLLGRAKNK